MIRRGTDVRLRGGAAGRASARAVWLRADWHGGDAHLRCWLAEPDFHCN